MSDVLLPGGVPIESRKYGYGKSGSQNFMTPPGRTNELHSRYSLPSVRWCLQYTRQYRVDGTIRFIFVRQPCRTAFWRVEYIPYPHSAQTSPFAAYESLHRSQQRAFYRIVRVSKRREGMCSLSEGKSQFLIDAIAIPFLQVSREEMISLAFYFLCIGQFAAPGKP